METADKNIQIEPAYSSDQGRICSSCSQWKFWSRYNRKPKGLNGYDSRCKTCISKAKKSYQKNKIKRYVETMNLYSVVIGKADKEKVDLVGRILATSLMALIDVGKIK